MDGAALFVQPPHLTQTGKATTLFKQTGGGQTNEQHVIIQNPSYNHPKLTAIMAHLEYEYAEYKYTVYRCSSKCVTLQKVFFTSNIPYKLVLAVMGRHGLQEAEGNLMVPPFQMTSLIHDIYFACEKLGHFSKTPSYNLETATSVLSNFFWNIFDPHRRHSISLLEIKVTFLLLCKLYSSDQLVAEFYNLFAVKKTKCVSKFNFEYLLSILTKIFTYIGEGSAYGAHNVPVIMEQCFARCHNPIGLTENQFHCLWTTTQTRFLIYANLIALIKRIEDTEKLIHNNVCASCHSEKIIGIRFKCQTCKNLSLCLKCFATGYATNKHESGHRMFECFTEDLPPKKLTHYFAKICTIFCTDQRNANEEETKGFCNTNETGMNNETELVTIGTHRSSNASTVSAAAALVSKNSSDIKDKIEELKPKDPIEPSLVGLTTTATNASNVSERLQLIIDRLLLQNSKLELQLKCVKTSTPEEISAFLKSHQKFLKDIINEMRNFGDLSRSVSSYPTSSTPNRSVFAKKATMLENFSGAQINSSSLTNSINGADLNRSYIEANKSDYSINDLSLWFNQKRQMSSSLSPPKQQTATNLDVLAEVTNAMEQAHAVASIIDSEIRDTEMTNFKLLLHKVKEIVEDSYSDNTELSAATQNLENVLDSIIQSEESRRKILP